MFVAVLIHLSRIYNTYIDNYRPIEILVWTVASWRILTCYLPTCKTIVTSNSLVSVCPTITNCFFGFVSLPRSRPIPETRVYRVKLKFRLLPCSMSTILQRTAKLSYAHRVVDVHTFLTFNFPLDDLSRFLLSSFCSLHGLMLVYLLRFRIPAASATWKFIFQPRLVIPCIVAWQIERVVLRISIWNVKHHLVICMYNGNLVVVWERCTPTMF